MKQKQLIITIIITFIVIMIWIIADIAHTRADIPVSSQLQQAIIPLNPTFDKPTLDEISKKVNLQNQILVEPPSPTSSPTNKP